MRDLDRLRYIITIDTRTLALFRVLLGLLIIGDLLARAGTFTFFYTEDGVSPQWLAQASRPEYSFSFFFWTTSTPVIAALFFLHGLFAIQLMLGYKTRIATIISFLFVISFDNHNPLVTSHSDSLFRMHFFWAMFLPLGERWSIDAIHRGTPGRPAIANLASAAILLQMVYMYLVNGAIKTQSTSWIDGSATPKVFGLDDMTYFLANYLREYPTLLSYGGWLWFGLLLASPLLLFLPGWPRALLAGLYATVHFSFGVTVRIGGFAWVAISGVILFLPAQFWDGLARLGDRFELVGNAGSSTLSAVERFGRALAAWLPATGIHWRLPQPVGTAVFGLLMAVAIVAVYVVPSTVHLHRFGIADREPTALEERIYQGALIMRIEQPRWSVFAPNPRSVAVYYIFPARTADGDLLDVYNDRPFSFERPYEELQHQYSNYRMRFYMNSVYRSHLRGGDVARLLADHICRTYEEDHGTELTHINMYQIQEIVTLDTVADHRDRETRIELFFTHGCGDHEPKEIEVGEIG